MAFVVAGSASASSAQASSVGTATSSTLRCRASASTSGTMGRAPSAPVPTMRRRHVHGMGSSRLSGVWPYLSRSGLEAFLSRLATRPRSMTTSRSIPPAVDVQDPEGDELRLHGRLLTTRVVATVSPVHRGRSPARPRCGWPVPRHGSGRRRTGRAARSAGRPRHRRRGSCSRSTWEAAFTTSGRLLERQNLAPEVLPGPRHQRARAPHRDSSPGSPGVAAPAPRRGSCAPSRSSADGRAPRR